MLPSTQKAGFAGGARLQVGKLGEPDLTPLIALAYGLDLAEPGVLLRERVQGPCELLVAASRQVLHFLHVPKPPMMSRDNELDVAAAVDMLRCWVTS